MRCRLTTCSIPVHHGDRDACACQHKSCFCPHGTRTMNPHTRHMDIICLRAHKQTGLIETA